MKISFRNLIFEWIDSYPFLNNLREPQWITDYDADNPVHL